MSHTDNYSNQTYPQGCSAKPMINEAITLISCGNVTQEWVERAHAALDVFHALEAELEDPMGGNGRVTEFLMVLEERLLALIPDAVEGEV